MHLIGRWERARAIGPNGPGHAYMIDRKWNTIAKIQEESNWVQLESGVYAPAVRGGSFFGARQSSFQNAFGSLGEGAATQTTVALSTTGYEFGVAGNVTGLRFLATEAITLTNIYFFITSYTGTAANVNDINVELRSGTVTAPTSAILTGQVINPASATGWINCSTLSPSFALVPGTWYWVLVADADASGTDFATVLNRATQLGFTTTSGVMRGLRAAYSSTNGASSISVQVLPGTIVIVGSTGQVIGNPFSTTATSTSSTNRRGLRFDGLEGNLRIFGMVNGVSSTGISGLELYETATLPGGTALATSTNLIPGADTATLGSVLFNSPYPIVRRNQVYRLVYTYSVAGTSPRRLQIGTGVDANLRTAMLGGGTMYWAEANGTTDWTNDNISEFPQCAVLIDDYLQALSTML